MHPRFRSATLLLLCSCLAASAADHLVLRGSGLRTKPILGTMYELNLLVPETLRTAEAPALIEADQPMEFVLAIQSRLITRARFVEATTEGFAKAAGAGYASDQTGPFNAQFDGVEFKRGDVITMRWAEGQLTTLYKSGETETTLGTLPGLDLKKALFAIWLGGAPVQESLKKALLGAP